MNNKEALQVVFKDYEEQWAHPSGDAVKARQASVDRLNSGETLRMVYHEFSNREPVERILFEAGAVGQQDLGLFVTPTIHIWKGHRE